MAIRTWHRPLPSPRSIGREGWRALARVSWLTLLGLAVLLVGATGDLIYHGLPDSMAHALEPVLGSEAYRAHVVTLVGMVLMVVGVIVGRGRP